jgi:hypothetical protein
LKKEKKISYLKSAFEPNFWRSPAGLRSRAACAAQLADATAQWIRERAPGSRTKSDPLSQI